MDHGASIYAWVKGLALTAINTFFIKKRKRQCE